MNDECGMRNENKGRGLRAEQKPAAWQKGGNAADAGGDLRLVRGGVCRRGLERDRGAARKTGVNRAVSFFLRKPLTGADRGHQLPILHSLQQ